MKSYLFSFGNSTVGPVGACARVEAESPEEALRIVKAAAPKVEELATLDTQHYKAGSGIEYFSVYFNHEAFTLDHIEESETEEVLPE